MEINLENLSHVTLMCIVKDLSNENEQLSTDLTKAQENAQCGGETNSEWGYRKQIKRDVLQDMLNNTVELNDTQAITVFGLVAKAGEKIRAIKAYQNRFGTGLKESKKAIEQWRKYLSP